MQRKIWVDRGAASSWELITFIPSQQAGEKAAAQPAPSSIPPEFKRRQTAAALVKTASRARMGPMSSFPLLDGSVLTVPTSSTLLFNPSHEILHDDISDLDDMHAASVLNLIQMRFLSGIVYTNIGNIIIAVNPYKSVPNLYDLPCSTTQPHIFNISQRAYDALWEEKRNQVIVVNGESGAGKTESTKIVLRHLSWLSSELEDTEEIRYEDKYSFEFGGGRGGTGGGAGLTNAGKDAGGAAATDEMSGSDSDDSEGIPASLHGAPGATHAIQADELVLSSNAVCEAFGNAATIHNLNSSRFGKYLSLHFDGESRCIDTCSIHHFLLEKSRVACHMHGERNFHAFYQMLQGASAKQRKEWRLHNHGISYYRFLTSTAPTVLTTKQTSRKRMSRISSVEPDAIKKKHIDPSEDAAAFPITCKSLESIGFTESEVNGIFSLLSAVLLLGNLEFSTSKGTDCSAAPASAVPVDKTRQIAHLRCDKADKKVHLDLAHVLGLPPETVSMTLGKAMTTRVMRTKRRSVTEIPLTLDSAEDSRNGLAKFLYSALFDHIFERLTACGGAPEDDGVPIEGATIGVLDIFGFEVLPCNSFEQLCINYANESLQALYNDFVFRQELQQYEDEGIDCSNIAYTDNSCLISMLDGRNPVGIFLLADQTGMRGGEAASDTAFLNLVNATFGNASKPHPFFARPRFGAEAFIVKHFAGDVTYSVDGFVKKNNDALHDDLQSMLQRCKAPFLMQIRVSDDNIEEDSSTATSSSHCTGRVTGSGNRPGKLTGTMTLGKQVRNEMKSLSSIIHDASPHFVRCIKPNTTMASAPEFDKSVVLQQLRHLGCLETCRIRRQGFPVRRDFSHIVEEYGILIGLGNHVSGEGAAVEVELSGTTTMREECVKILASHANHSLSSDSCSISSTPDDSFRAGTSKVFLRNGVIEILNAAKDTHLARRNAASIIIQSCMRQFWAGLQVENMRVERNRLRGAVAIQAALRGSWGRQRADRVRTARDMKQLQEDEWNASVKLQQICRGHFTRRRRHIERLQNERSKHQAAVRVQASLRTFVAAQSFQERRNAVSRIASFYRSKRTKEEFVYARKNAILIQTSLRRAIAMKRYHRELRLAQRLAATIAIQKTHRCFMQRCQWTAIKALVLVLQRMFRGHRVRRYVVPFIRIRRPWKHILFPNEVLLRVSYCAKFAGTGISRLMGRKKRRLLFLTSAGRVIYFKHRSAKIKGEFLIDRNDPFGVNMIDDSLFECIAPTRKYKFFDLFRDSKGWAKTVKLFLIHVAQDKLLEPAESVYETTQSTKKTDGRSEMKQEEKTKKSCNDVLSLSSLMFSLDMDPTLAYLKQGLLFKRRSAQKGDSANPEVHEGWASRWFILHGDILYWFKGNGEGKPRGKIIIGAGSKIVSSAERNFCFKLITPLFRKGILLAAASTRDKRAWTQSLNRIINRSKAREGNIPAQLSQDTNKTWHARMISMAPARSSILSGSQNLPSLKRLSRLKEEEIDEGPSYVQGYEYGFDSETDSDDESIVPSAPESNDNGISAASSVRSPQVHTRNRSSERLYLEKKGSSAVLF